MTLFPSGHFDVSVRRSFTKSLLLTEATGLVLSVMTATSRARHKDGAINTMLIADSRTLRIFLPGHTWECNIGTLPWVCSQHDIGTQTVVQVGSLVSL